MRIHNAAAEVQSEESIIRVLHCNFIGYRIIPDVSTALLSTDLSYISSPGLVEFCLFSNLYLELNKEGL